VAPWGFGLGYLHSFFLAFTFQKSNVIFPFTYAFAVACFVAVIFAGVRWAHLDWFRTLLIAGTVPFAGPGVFEIAFQETGHFVRPALFVGYALPYVMLSYATWGIVGLTGGGWWRVTRRWWAVLAYSIGGFLLWIAIGFPLVTTGSFTQLPAAYLLNISLKGSFYLLFLLPVLEGMHCGRRSAESSVLGRMGVVGVDPVPPQVEDPVRAGPESAAT
jgi:hypothetical protein